MSPLLANLLQVNVASSTGGQARREDRESFVEHVALVVHDVVTGCLSCLNRSFVELPYDCQERTEPLHLVVQDGAQHEAVAIAGQRQGLHESRHVFDGRGNLRTLSIALGGLNLEAEAV